MNLSDHPSGSGKQKEIQGPRPRPLKVQKTSHKVRKPPQIPQHRPPVIIYTVSPTVIHTNPSDFRSLVQRLTGPTATTLNSIEPLKSESVREPGRAGILSPGPGSMLAISPGLFAPPVVDTNTSVRFLQGLSPVGFAGSGNRNYADNTFLVSPGNLLSANLFPSPGAYWDLFNQYQNQSPNLLL